MKLKANKGPGNHFMALIAKPLTILWLGGVLFLIVASVIPQAGLSEIESGFGKDKIARIIIFSLLAFYPAAFFPSIRMGLITSTSIAPLGFLLEVFQRYVPGRNFSPEDMIANNVGAVVGILLALAIRFFFRTGRWKQGVKTRASDTRFVAKEDEVTKTPKKSWRSKLIIFSLLLVMGYIAWVIFLQNKPGPPLPTLTKPSPAKTVIKEKTQTNTAPDHPIRYRSEPDHSKTTLPKTHISGNDLPVVSPPSPDRQPQQDKKPQPPPTTTPEPELIPEPDAVEDSPPPFLEIELQHRRQKPRLKKHL